MMNDKPEELLDEALDFDDLDSVSGGAGSNNYVEADGTVSGVGESGIILVNVGGQTVNAYLSGKLRMNFVKFRPGNTVHLQYDPVSMKGRITRVFK